VLLEKGGNSRKVWGEPCLALLGRGFFAPLTFGQGCLNHLRVFAHIVILVNMVAASSQQEEKGTEIAKNFPK